MSLELVRLNELLELARARAASDLHVGGAESPCLRLEGRLVMLDVPALAADALHSFVDARLDPRAAAQLERSGTADVACRSGPGAPYRLHVYRTTAGLRLAFRLLAAAPPALENLGLPALVATFGNHPNGLVLFTGPTGSGKTTALAGLIDRINRTSDRVIVSVEDPVEYIHRPIRSLVGHCEIGADVASYREALRSFLRADPDVILVGEMRDDETMEAVLTAAETGHLVLSTLHTNDAPQTVDRILDAFPSDAQAQIRSQLAATIIAIVSLRLVADTRGRRLPAAEILVGTDAVRAMIREGKTHQLRNALTTGRAAGMQTLEAHLSELVARGAITLETARQAANRTAEIRDVERVG